MDDTILKKSRHSLVWFTVILFGVSFGLGILLGNVLATRKQLVNEQGSVEITKVLNLYSKSRSPEVKFDQFWNVWDLIKSKYVKQPVDDVKLFYGALEGLVQGLDDSHSVYFPPKKAEEFATSLSGEFEGIGAEIGIKDSQLVVVAPLSASPAERAGLKSGDKIYKINNEETYNMTLDEAINKIRGPKDTEVKLTISHDGLEKIEEIKIVRATINIPTVILEMKANDIAYLRLAYFNENTWNEFNKTIKTLLLQNSKKLILDLRSNPGGYLDTAVKVASEWVENGTIVSEKFSDGRENKYATDGRHRLAGVKTVVLIDEGSASASEIVAGALQDYGLAKIIGAKSYGKGSVQEFKTLPDGSAIKLTVAYWYTPLGRQIEKEGIAPDLVLEKMVEEVKVADGKTEVKDLGLEKALELLQK